MTDRSHNTSQTGYRGQPTFQRYSAGGQQPPIPPVEGSRRMDTPQLGPQSGAIPPTRRQGPRQTQQVAETSSSFDHHIADQELQDSILVDSLIQLRGSQGILSLTVSDFRGELKKSTYLRSPQITELYRRAQRGGYEYIVLKIEPAWGWPFFICPYSRSTHQCPTPEIAIDNPEISGVAISVAAELGVFTQYEEDTTEAVIRFPSPPTLIDLITLIEDLESIPNTLRKSLDSFVVSLESSLFSSYNGICALGNPYLRVIPQSNRSRESTQTTLDSASNTSGTLHLSQPDLEPIYTPPDPSDEALYYHHDPSRTNASPFPGRGSSERIATLWNPSRSTLEEDIALVIRILDFRSIPIPASLTSEAPGASASISQSSFRAAQTPQEDPASSLRVFGTLMDFIPRFSIPLSEFCTSVLEDPSLMLCTVEGISRRKTLKSLIVHRFVELRLTGEGNSTVFIRADRRASKTRRQLKLVMSSNVPPRDEVVVAPNRDALAIDPFEISEVEAEMSISEPPTLHDFVKVLSCIVQAMPHYDLITNNCWLFASAIEDVLLKLTRANYTAGGPFRPAFTASELRAMWVIISGLDDLSPQMRERIPPFQ